MSLLVAIGGNAVHPENIKGTTEEQERIAECAARVLLPLAKATDRLLITHGNGPVVGKILLRMMLTRDAVPPMRLDVCVAHSQGGIGYMLIQALENEMRRSGLRRDATCVITQVEVDPDDPAFADPSKPIGPFFAEREAREFEEKGWRMMEDAGRGWRHCVASPEPRSVLNVDVIRRLLDAGILVIAGGGGGVPVTRDGRGEWTGVQAVIDKDLTSALLARSLGIEDLLILTAVERVALDFGTPRAAQPGPSVTLFGAQEVSTGRPFRQGQHGAEGRGRHPARRRAAAGAPSSATSSTPKQRSPEESGTHVVAG